MINEKQLWNHVLPTRNWLMGWRGPLDAFPSPVWFEYNSQRSIEHRHGFTDAALELAQSAYFLKTCQHFCFVCERPAEVHTDDVGRPSNPEGPAILWRDGSQCWAINGLPMKPRKRHKLTPAVITREKNVEVRRALREHYGTERYLRDIGGRMVHADGWGELWETEVYEDGAQLVMVKVINATPEPDGHYRDFFLRVPPTMKTAHQAVAWTYGHQNADDYAPLVET